MLSVIIPIYNRRDHLYLTLTALDCQGYRDFEVIVADDGSTDHPEVVCAHFNTCSVRYIRLEHDGFGANRCRNAGAAIVHPDSTALIFLDSGILLNRHALQHYANLHGPNPDCLIGGRYDWLPPMRITPADIIGRWQDIIDGNLEHSRSWNAMELEGIVGPDPRVLKYPDFFDRSEQQFYFNYALELFGGNMLVPRDRFIHLGGFDEVMNRHGGEDCEFAIRAQKEGYAAIFAEEVVGYHMYHERNQDANAVSVLTNIAYIRSRHDLVALGIVDGEDEQLPLVREEV